MDVSSNTLFAAQVTWVRIPDIPDTNMQSWGMSSTGGVTLLSCWTCLSFTKTKLNEPYIHPQNIKQEQKSYKNIIGL